MTAYDDERGIVSRKPVTVDTEPPPPPPLECKFRSLHWTLAPGATCSKCGHEGPPVAKLTAEQKIRRDALDSATGVYLGRGAEVDRYALGDAVLALAERFAQYIHDGSKADQP